MDAAKIGSAIQFLRNRAGYTQKELAERLSVSDKAVSRWERGVGIPDISLLRRLSIILDTDIDSLLEGAVVAHEKAWKGLLYIDKDPSIMIYDKPLSDYLISYFLLMTVRDIIVFGEEEYLEYVRNRYNNGELYGINISCCSIYNGSLSDSIIHNQDVFAQSSVAALLSSCVLYGVDLTRFLYRGMISTSCITALAIVRNDKRSNIRIDSDKKVSYESKNTSIITRYNYSLLPFLFLRNGIKRIKEYSFNSFIDLSNTLITNSALSVEMMDKGFVNYDCSNPESVFEAGAFIRLVQKNTGSIICCPAEIAYRRGMITKSELTLFAEMKNDQYLTDL